jgi:hypothetical protein
MSAVLVVMLVLAQAPCQEQSAALLADALDRAAWFDLTAAAAGAERSRALGCRDADVAAIYLRGLVEAREAARVGGSVESLEPVRRAIDSLDALAGTDPRAAIARAVLRAAAAAAQSERGEMAVHLAEAESLELLQLAAGQRPAPGVAAHEAAGELWLLVHRYEDARRLLDRARQRLGETARATLGLARAAARQNDVQAACDQYRALVRRFGERAGEPPELAEARAYLSRSCAAPDPPQPQ